MSRYYRLPVEHLRHCLYGLSTKHLQAFLGRGDFILSPTGLKCSNTTSPQAWAVCSHPSGTHVFTGPLIAKLIEDLQLKITLNNVIANLSNTWQQSTGMVPHEEEINIAFVIHDLKTLALMSISGQAKNIDHMYTGTLKNKQPGKRNVIFCLFEELMVKGDYLYYKNKRIHSVLDNFRAEFPEEFLEILKKENVLIYNGPISACSPVN